MNRKKLVFRTLPFAGDRGEFSVYDLERESTLWADPSNRADVSIDGPPKACFALIWLVLREDDGLMFVKVSLHQLSRFPDRQILQSVVR